MSSLNDFGRTLMQSHLTRLPLSRQKKSLIFPWLFTDQSRIHFHVSRNSRKVLTLVLACLLPSSQHNSQSYNNQRALTASIKRHSLTHSLLDTNSASKPRTITRRSELYNHAFQMTAKPFWTTVSYCLQNLQSKSAVTLQDRSIVNYPVCEFYQHFQQIK